MDISFELNLDQIFIMRKCYSIFDLLSDMGGMIGILTGFFSSVAGIFNFNNFDNYMVSRLFKVKKMDAKTSQHLSYFNKAEFIDPTKYHNFFEWFIDKMPCQKRYCCCPKSRE